MKRFDQLTQEQQMKAIEFAQRELKDSFSLGLIESNKPLSDSDILGLAMDAAEGGQYTDDGAPFVAQLDVPFIFQGGCV